MDPSRAPLAVLVLLAACKEEPPPPRPQRQPPEVVRAADAAPSDATRPPDARPPDAAPLPPPLTAERPRVFRDTKDAPDPKLVAGAPLGRAYLRVSLDVTLRERVPADAVLNLRAACPIGDRRLSDFGSKHLEDLRPGETENVMFHVFYYAPLDEAPRTCSLEATYHPGGSYAPGAPLAAWCLDGDKLSDGACPLRAER